MSARARRAAALAAMALLASACSFAASAEPDPGVVNECQDDGECPGSSCDPGFAMCISPTPMAMRVGFDVLPETDPAGGAPVRSYFAEEAISAPTTLDLTVQPRLTVVGVVRWGDTRIPADLTFTRAPAFPGGPSPSLRATTLPDPSEAADGLPADYAVRLAAGETYQVVVQPVGDAGRDLPPLFATVDAPRDRGEVGRADFTYPPSLSEPCVVGSLRGCTFAGQIVSTRSDGSQGPESGLLVKAIEVATGRVVSSTSETGAGAEPGVFSIVIAGDAGPFLLRIIGGSSRGLFPVITADPAFLFPGVSPPRLLVPQLPTVRFRGFVEDTSGERIADATVTFRSENVFDETLGITGSFSTTAQSGSPATAEPLGEFVVELLPGTYDVVVTPPSGRAELAVHTTQGVVVAPREDGLDIMGQVFAVATRSRFNGRVATVDERLMAGATVQASARAVWSEDSAAAAYNRSSDATTDGTGQFDLPLDVGTYDLFVKPPAESQFSWVVVPDLEMGSTGRTFSDSFPLESPTPVAGRVLSPDGEPLAGAEVRAWTILGEVAGTERAVQIGRAVSGEDGTYRLLLPPRLQ